MDEMLKQQLKEEVAQFRQKAEQFMRGEINIKEFKGFSGGFGSYAQRGKTHAHAEAAHGSRRDEQGEAGLCLRQLPQA